MAKKISSPAKALYIIFALALVFSAIPALAVTLSSSAVANVVNGATAYGSDFILDEAGNGMARWVWDDIVEPGGVADYHSSNHAAYLKALNEGDSAQVIVTWGCTIDEITGLSYWYRNPEAGLGPIMGLAIDTPTHDGLPNYYAVVNTCPGGNSVWTQWYEDFTAAHWNVYDATAQPVGGQQGITWDAMVTFVGADAKVLAVTVGYDYGRNIETCWGEAFVDDITVNDRDWDLEPLETDCVKSELGAAKSGYPIQIEVDDISKNVEGHEDLEESTTAPNGATSTFDVAHAPKAVGTTSAYDLGGQLTVTGVAQVNDAGTVTVTETPPATYPVFPGVGCAHAEADMNPSVITLTTPTQLTVTSLNHIVDADPNNNPDCNVTAPGQGMWMYIFISGYSGAGTPINELLYILGDDTQETTTQDFASIIAYGIDATYSTGSAATALFISAENHVWVTYDWHQHDTVTVFAQTDVEMVEVELIEVDPFTLEPDKDSGFFKGILYPVTTSTKIVGPAGALQRHDLLAPHCKTIELKYPENDPQYIFDTFKVDNDPPVFSNASPLATNEEYPLISVDISDTKCDVTKDKISLYVSENDPPTDGEVAPANFDFTDGTVTYTPSLPLTDGTYYVRVKAADCCWNWAEIDWSFEVESTPPRMIDAITGWGWYWGHPRGPQNLNLRTTIMVVFSEPLDPTTVEPGDFTVNYATPVDVEYHDYSGSWPGDCGNNPNGHDYGLVFLTLATPLATNATPTVTQVGVVEDLAGNPCDKPYTWYCNGGQSLELPQTVTAQDGIAPAITVTASDEDPGYNETVTITATSSEPLSAAYLFVGEGNPWDYYWDECKPIGWGLFGPDVPCSATGHVPETTWDGRECSTCHSRCEHGVWMLMTEGATPYVWTASFTNEMMPNKLWFAEVAAHDFTQWWVDMGAAGQWQDYDCNWYDKRWKHEKWTQESFLFGAWDVEFLDLCEGWNLISVPWDLVYSSPQALFNVRTNVGVTKVYHYTGGQYGYWQYATLNPISGYWTGTITTIEPGKAYWVWVSPPWMELVLHILPPDALTPPKTFSLKKGYNMHGYVEMADSWGARTGEDCDDCVSTRSDNLLMRNYFQSLYGIAMVMYAYDPCEIWYEVYRGRGDPNWIRFDAGEAEDFEWHMREMRVGAGYWLFVPEDVLFAP